MANLLSENITRAVVREVVVAKSPVLNAILEALTHEITPVIREHARALILASIDPDPRQKLVESCYGILDRVDMLLQQLANGIKRGIDEEQIQHHITHTRTMIDDFLQDVEHRSESVFKLEMEADAAQAGKDGAA